MKKHVDLLVWLYTAWGAVFLIVALAGVALAAGAWAIATGVSPVQVSSPMSGQVTAAGLASMAGLTLLWALLHLALARALAALRIWGRTLVLGLSIVNLLLLPFGTALAAYSWWVLLKDETRRLFHA
jgi:hypothetical protein